MIIRTVTFLELDGYIEPAKTYRYSLNITVGGSVKGSMDNHQKMLI